VNTDNAHPWSYSWDTSLEVPGSKNLTAMAYDLTGNNTLSSTVTVTIEDTQSPTTPQNLREDSTGLTTATISWDASSDNVAVTGYSVYREGAVIGSTGSTSYSDSGLTPNTTYQYTVQAYDAAGNTSSQATPLDVTTDADVTGPSVSITNPADGSTISDTVSVNVSASDNIAVDRVEIWIDGSLEATLNSGPYAYSWNTTLFADGNHTLLARGYDAAGNFTDDSHTLTIDNPRRGDVNGDKVVDVLDLSILLSQWGNNYPDADFDGSGTVDILDLSTLLSEYGT
ncbi:MAG: Ig-like domain-containing protein, partial [Candidatus Saccharimonadales bacterium]|nr:Ig-like domain-containing protein [Candidatus Saccharimonadales bacterium]